MNGAVVLVSGGADSATCLGIAKEMEVVHADLIALTIRYGQRHVREVDAAAKIAAYYKATHMIVDLPIFGTRNTLVNMEAQIPNVAYSELPGISPLYVPNRNMIFIAVAGAIALENELRHVYFGAHKGDHEAWSYPDCSPQFVEPLADALYEGSGRKVHLFTPFLDMSKAMLIRTGAAKNVPYELTWSCYAGGEKHCGVCPTCRERKLAFTAAGVTDPTEYDG